MVVRTTGDPAHEIPAFRSAVRTLAPAVPVSDIFIMRDVVDAAADGTRFTLVLLGAFATVALAMAGLGVFGVVSHDVSTRRRELGIRVALGASRQQVVADLVRDSARAAAAGLAVGLGAAWLLGGEIRSLLFGVTPFDGRTLLVVTGGLAVIAALACLVPALGASRISVVQELKRE
jgi:ABC-type antimicrobial peptide transport system permease subunit